MNNFFSNLVIEHFHLYFSLILEAFHFLCYSVFHLLKLWDEYDLGIVQVNGCSSINHIAPLSHITCCTTASKKQCSSTHVACRTEDMNVTFT